MAQQYGQYCSFHCAVDSAELELDAMSASRVFPFDVTVVGAENAATAAFEAAVGNERNGTVGLNAIARGWADVGAAFVGTVIGAYLRVLDMDMWPTYIHAIAVLI
ncbi:hypothetical protein CBM2633_P220011 [Cupriavidus taiwanensis]|uniref:Uncharacterized protein n=2 Tax=Cupriavidus TaxID=106589 RepID=A0A375CN77_9BURK|nr:hypothetical protein CBM2592_P250010 [Cupriavidus taiwanensis]SOZ40500.1 hypothetical protein CBM2605_P220007 [Cupriavidus neocaledonicus]SOY74966.1 hypothetical protein CBM2588_P240010 [Cupriavidus taiwanensis]SOY74967.1 hypothetical protein CBM2585_P220012 [Cupriavidus taiwanensis]SOY75801.1 hypothetical protein CBM2589_P220007 [Cupriavidus taiwanensis]